MFNRSDSPALTSTSERRILLAILVFALLVRVGAMVALQTWKFHSEREFGYETGEIGYALANGQGFSWPQTWRPVGPGGRLAKRDHPEPTTWEAPIYPLIIATAFRAFGSYSATAAVALELFQVFLALLGCYLLFRLGKRIFNAPAGLLAAFLLAIYPTAIHFSVQKTEYSMLLVFLALLLMLQTLQLSERPTLGRSIALGAISGVATLVNPVIIAFYPFGLAWFLLRSRDGWLKSIKYAAAIVACCAALMVPWLVRNYLVFDRFVFLRPNFTQELVHSNFPEQAVTVQPQNSPHINDAQTSALYNQAAKTLVLQNKLRFLTNTAERALDYWVRLEFTGGLKFKMVLGTAYYSMLILGLIGVWLGRRQYQTELLILFLLAMPLPFYMTWAVVGRYRFPVEPVLILFASYTVTLLAWRLIPSSRHDRATSPSAAAPAR
jgi:4-amino-4-deoxy-L-arabinose transferase-like glycosyltransferase